MPDSDDKQPTSRFFHAGSHSSQKDTLAQNGEHATTGPTPAPTSSGQHSTEAPGSIDELEDELDEIGQSLRQIQKSGQWQRWAPVFLFAATFFGTLLGIVADLSDASGLAEPILETFNPSPEVRIVGSDTILGGGISMALDWATEFQEQHRSEVHVPLIGPVECTIKVDVDAVGTVRGVEKALAGEKVSILAASEPLTPDRIEKLAEAGVEIRCAAEIGYDVIAFITNINNVVPAVARDDVSRILTGEIRDWFAVNGNPQPIRVLARKGSGTTEVVLRAFTGSPEWRDHFRTCEDNQSCLDVTLSTPGSLYWVSAAWMRTQPSQYMAVVPTKRGPTMPPANPIDPEFDPDRYTRELIRPLYMYVLTGPAMDEASIRLAEEFLRYVRGVHGQQILSNYYFFTFFDPPTDVDLILPPGFEPDENGFSPVCKK